jgi:hypothetical protein
MIIYNIIILYLLKMSYRKIGYNYVKDKKEECFENIMLVYDFGDLYWITLSDRTMKKIDKYFCNSEFFIMGFSLIEKDNYNMKFITNIKYEDIINDLISNNLYDKLKLKFSEKDYNKNLIFNINANTFNDAINELYERLSFFKFTLI